MRQLSPEGVLGLGPSLVLAAEGSGPRSGPDCGVLAEVVADGVCVAVDGVSVVGEQAAISVIAPKSTAAVRITAMRCSYCFGCSDGEASGWCGASGSFGHVAISVDHYRGQCPRIGIASAAVRAVACSTVPSFGRAQRKSDRGLAPAHQANPGVGRMQRLTPPAPCRDTLPVIREAARR